MVKAKLAWMWSLQETALGKPWMKLLVPTCNQLLWRTVQKRPWAWVRISWRNALLESVFQKRPLRLAAHPRGHV